MNKFRKLFGLALLVTALGHSGGVLHFYFVSGVPEANRVLLDVWIAEAQLLGGCLFLAAYRESRAGKSARTLTVFGSLIIIGFSAPLLPVLFFRAPVWFQIPTAIYLLLSFFFLASSIRTKN